MDRRDEYHKLYSCYLKLERVQQHASVLQDAMDGFLGSKPYSIICERDPKLGEYILWTKVREEPPPEWSPIIGDIIHNWRSALDHLAYQLVIRNGETPDHRTQFPIFSKSPFDASLYSKTKDAKRARERWDRQVRGMHPNDETAIKAWQPYNGGYGSDIHPLDALNQLSNWDKHREYQLSSQTRQGTTFKVRDWRDCEWWPLYERPVGPFEDGTVVARYAFTATGPNPKIDVNIKEYFDFTLGKGSPLEGLGVKKMLLAIGPYVHDIIEEFRIKVAGQMF
jgi:hypothetical protein